MHTFLYVYKPFLAACGLVSHEQTPSHFSISLWKNSCHSLFLKCIYTLADPVNVMLSYPEAKLQQDTGALSGEPPTFPARDVTKKDPNLHGMSPFSPLSAQGQDSTGEGSNDCAMSVMPPILVPAQNSPGMVSNDYKMSPPLAPVQDSAGEGSNDCGLLVVPPLLDPAQHSTGMVSNDHKMSNVPLLSAPVQNSSGAGSSSLHEISPLSAPAGAGSGLHVMSPVLSAPAQDSSGEGSNDYGTSTVSSVSVAAQNAVAEGSNEHKMSPVNLPPTVRASTERQSVEPPTQMSFASLLQGSKSKPKQKTSQTTKSPLANSDAGSLVSASNPALSAPAQQSVSPRSGHEALSTDDHIPQVSEQSANNSTQFMENKSFDSVARTSELQHSREMVHNDPNPHEHPSRREEPYYQERRDPYYHQDQRDTYDNQNRRDPYYDQDRRDVDRPYYDRREPERRNYDSRREYDRREGDYNRRSYDGGRDYDRRSYDGRDYVRRDSYDNRDPYYSHGYSSRQGRRGYDDGRTSREEMYRGSYHSGRSTPSSDRNSPAPYDYSAYASHQYGYPSYTDAQSMDLYQYQYLMYLYQFHPQHYEQYCAQLGYYNMGYTPEQLTQYYGGMYNSSGYEKSQTMEQG